MNINPMEVLKRGIIIAPKDYPLVTDFKEKECQISSNGIDLRINETVVIEPKSFKNVEIMERFNMDGVFGAIWIRSSFSRRGIFHTAGLFDDGNEKLKITLNNMSEDAIMIEKGTRICQMVFFKTSVF